MGSLYGYRCCLLGPLFDPKLTNVIVFVLILKFNDRDLQESRLLGKIKTKKLHLSKAPVLLGDFFASLLGPIVKDE